MHVPIRYREFYDVPRVFLVRYHGKLFLFESVFNEELDDYSTEYEIYLMPDLSDDELNGSWEKINEHADKKVGKVPVDAVAFDRTRRKYIDEELLAEIEAAAEL